MRRATAPRLDAERQALVEESLPVVRSVVASVAAGFPRHADRDELVQAGALGMVEAAHRFDPERGVPFEIWVSRRVRGAVLDAVRAMDFAPRALRAHARAVELVRLQLEAELGRTPTTEETAERAGLSVADVHALDGRVHGSVVLSLDVPLDEVEAEHVTLASTLVDDALGPLELLELRERARYVRDALACLPARVRSVIVGYFLEGSTSAELAAEFGVTESRISQLRSEGLALLRLAVDAQYGIAPDPQSPIARRAADVADELARTSSYHDRLSTLPLPRSAEPTPLRLPVPRVPQPLEQIA